MGTIGVVHVWRRNGEGADMYPVNSVQDLEQRIMSAWKRKLYAEAYDNGIGDNRQSIGGVSLTAERRWVWWFDSEVK